MRALPVLAAAGDKRLAIQNQVIVESGSLQPRRSGRGGTGYATKERLLACRQDVQRGLASSQCHTKVEEDGQQTKTTMVPATFMDHHRQYDEEDEA